MSTPCRLTPADRELLREIGPLIQQRDLSRAGYVIDKLTAYYRDLDRADRTPRRLLYFHLGYIAGAAQALDAAVREKWVVVTAEALQRLMRDDEEDGEPSVH